MSGRLIMEGIDFLKEFNMLLDVLVDPCVYFKLPAPVSTQKNQKREVLPGWVDLES